MIKKFAIAASLAATIAVPAIAVPAAQAARWPPVARVELIHGCANNRNGTSLNSCVCIFNYAEARVSLAKLLRQGQAYKLGGPAPSILRAAAHHCGVQFLG